MSGATPRGLAAHRPPGPAVEQTAVFPPGALVGHRPPGAAIGPRPAGPAAVGQTAVFPPGALVGPHPPGPAVGQTAVFPPGIIVEQRGRTVAEPALEQPATLAANAVERPPRPAIEPPRPAIEPPGPAIEPPPGRPVEPPAPAVEKTSSAPQPSAPRRAVPGVDSAIAIDVGGTGIRGELVTPDGVILARIERPTPPGPAARDAVADLGSELLRRAPGRVVGAGVVLPGLVDSVKGFAVHGGDLGWRKMELVGALGHVWRIPVRVASAVGSGAVVEHRYGAARGLPDFAFVSIGARIDAVLVTEGRLRIGARGECAQLGHLSVRADPRCGCGGNGCVVTLASSLAIAQRYELTGGPTVPGAREVVPRLGLDPVADLVWGQAVAALAEGLVNLVLMSATPVVVIGGGVVEAGAALLEPLVAALGDRVRVVEPPRLAAAAYGGRGAIVGAALLAYADWTRDVVGDAGR